ncbi:MAG: hypothetical protein Q7T55_08950, partial [Solirubrobacteraceae bacterium]|nr:hypothetical protein [Solirubrobacteraceae bacterium]
MPDFVRARPLGARNPLVRAFAFALLACALLLTALAPTNARAEGPELIPYSETIEGEPDYRMAAGGPTCMIKQNGYAVCVGLPDWASNVPADLGKPKGLAVGQLGACGIKQDNTLRCFGNNTYGENNVPANVGAVKQVAYGRIHVCAIRSSDRNVVCWGNNENHELDIPANLGPVKEISAGTQGTCAIKQDDTVACWGTGLVGQFDFPAGFTAKSVSLGSGVSCAIKLDDMPWCTGQFPNGASVVPPASIGMVRQVNVGSYHACGIRRANNEMACWGVETQNDASLNPPAGLGEVEQIAVGEGTACAVKLAGGAPVCWGINFYGQPYNTNQYDNPAVPTPTPVPTPTATPEPTPVPTPTPT